MNRKRKYKIMRILTAIFWFICGIGVLVLFSAAVSIKGKNLCKGNDINIRGVQNNFFIEKQDVSNFIQSINKGMPAGKPINSFDLLKIKNELKKNVWIKEVEIFIDNNEILQVNISEREPVARIFPISGSSFYLDTTMSLIPLSNKFSARLPVFTGFTGVIGKLLSTDSAMLLEIKNLSYYILKDSFWMAQIDQVNILGDGTFEIIPKIGNQVIDFGNANNYNEKFNNLLSFYKKIQCKAGWNKYSKISVRYKGQVIAMKRGLEDEKMDSLRTMQIMQAIQANIDKQTQDSATIQFLQKDDNTLQVIPVIINSDLPEERILSTDSITKNNKPGIN